MSTGTKQNSSHRGVRGTRGWWNAEHKNLSLISQCCMNVREIVSKISTFSNSFGSVRTCWDLFRGIRMCPDMLGHVWTGWDGGRICAECRRSQGRNAFPHVASLPKLAKFVVSSVQRTAGIAGNKPGSINQTQILCRTDFWFNQ